MRRLGWRRLKTGGVGAAVLAALLLAPGDTRSAAARDLRPIAALAPVDVLASGFVELSGVAVEPSGTILLTDRAAGTLMRLHPGGRHEPLLDGLHGPIGVAQDRAGRIVVAEAAGRRILRITPGGAVTVLAATLRQPRAVAVGPDDRVFVAMRADTKAEFVIARLEESGAVTEVVSGLSDVEAIAVAPDAIYVATKRLVQERGNLRTIVARIPIDEDGVAGAVEPLIGGALHRALAVGVDVLNDVFIGGVAIDGGDGRSGTILKRHSEGRVTVFAAGLTDPAGLALTPSGDLIAIERRHPGRVLRFRAPLPPVPAVPAFTNQSPLSVAGLSEPGARIQLLQPPRSEPLASTTADTLGDFTLPARLAPNTATELVFRATAANGLGLTGAAAVTSVTHDDIPPRVTPLEPSPGMHTRMPVILRARAEDEGSGPAAVTFLLEDRVVAAVTNPAPPAALLAGAVLQTEAVAEGPHGLTVAAVDRAGNQAALAQLLVVDRTPPDTWIVAGPAPETAERNVRFEVGGGDLWSPTLDYSWRLDAGAWSPYDPSVAVDLDGLTQGRHRFEVRARDLAGNEDPTPAVQSFTVQSLRVRILEPADGQLVTTDSIWIRGAVESSDDIVSVTLALPAAFGGSLTASVEGGTFAMEVPADPELTTFTVVAAGRTGATAQASVSVVVASDRSSVESLEVWPPGGLAPVTVRLGLHGFSGVPAAIDLDGDGVLEFDGVLSSDDFYGTYSRAGIYVPTVWITTPDGEVRARRALVEVYERSVLDARLQAVWKGFKDALRKGDIDAVVSFVVEERRQAWAEYFRALPADAMADVDQVFPAISLVEVGAGGAQYEMVAERDGVLFSYAIWFQVDADGRWRLWRF